MASDDGVAEEARTRGFVPQAFAGFAFVAAGVGTRVTYHTVSWLSSASVPFSSVDCLVDWYDGIAGGPERSCGRRGDAPRRDADQRGIRSGWCGQHPRRSTRASCTTNPQGAFGTLAGPERDSSVLRPSSPLPAYIHLAMPDQTACGRCGTQVRPGAPLSDVRGGRLEPTGAGRDGLRHAGRRRPHGAWPVCPARRPAPRHPRPLRHSGRAGPGGHGHRVPRPRHRARPQSGDQGDVAGVVRDRRHGGAVQTRGPHRRGLESPTHHSHLRRARRCGFRLLRHEVRRGPLARVDHAGGRTPAPPVGARRALPGWRGARLRPSPRRRAPGREARQRHARHGRLGRGDGLRDREGRGDAGPHDDGCHHRHPVVHEPGTVRGEARAPATWPRCGRSIPT